MQRLIPIALLSAVCLFAQQAEMAQKEQEELQEAISEAGNSPVEFMRALERHLKKYPNSPRKADMERGIVKAAVEAKDHKRIVLYGEKVLERDLNDIVLLEAISRALVSNDDKASAEKALKYSGRLEKAIQEKAKNSEEVKSHARAYEEMSGLLGRVYIFEARANGNLGKTEAAAALARKSFETNPTADACREVARWLQKGGQNTEALKWFADAFTIADPKSTEAQRAKDRLKLGEIFSKLRGSEKGLGDVVLEAYDRTAAVMLARQQKLKEIDPNAAATDPFDFTITAMGGEKLNLATLKGKVVVMDFWATWCGPCRAQKPLYDQVKKRFAGNQDVVFLAINTDEDKSAVAPFIESNKWSKSVYFEDGLAGVLRISSIPTALVFGRRGEIVSRMNGFVPDRFVDMLSDRIKDALVD